jgi:hypothetical protein
MACFAVNFTLLYLTSLLKESLQAHDQNVVHNLEFPHRHPYLTADLQTFPMNNV